MWTVAVYLPALALVLFANLGVKYPTLKTFTYVCLALLNVLCLLIALLLLASSLILQVSGQPPPGNITLPGLMVLGLGTAATALAGILCLLPPLRRLLARWLPLDAASPVHATALMFSVYLGASSLSLLLTDQRLMQISLQDVSLDVATLVAGEAVFAILALLGVGLFTRRKPAQVLERLGLNLPKLSHIALACASIMVLLGIDLTVSHVWHTLWPQSYELVAKTSESLFSGFATPWHALILGLSAGVGEELLFRGALQPRFGILLTTLLFTVVHVQYSLSPALLEILAIGLILGWLRQKRSTSICIIVHAGYNFLSMLLAPLLP